MPTYLITAEDRQWFATCRRSWDLGARARHDRESTGPEDPLERASKAVRDGLAVYYFPGMWTWDRTIVEPLVFAAIERGGGGDDEKDLAAAYTKWAPSMDSFTPLWTAPDIEVDVPDPDRPDCDLAAPDGAIVKYRDRPTLLVAEEGERDEYWLLEHRIVDRWSDHDELVLDERGILACWAWGQYHLAMPIEGMLYNELRRDRPEFRRTRIRRPKAEQERAAGRLGRAVKEMLRPDLAVDPTPGWAHCSRCAFRAACIAMNTGGDAATLMAEGSRPRPPDVLEEGRLGGVSWGMSRGAARAFGRRRY
ncbi:MAG: hypothetical protein M3N98_10950 [Actinomycetota bacterium]|nr:hypothetical protein [Actinomycetota bacterium]